LYFGVRDFELRVVCILRCAEGIDFAFVIVVEPLDPLWIVIEERGAEARFGCAGGRDGRVGDIGSVGGVGCSAEGDYDRNFEVSQVTNGQFGDLTGRFAIARGRQCLFQDFALIT